MFFTYGGYSEKVSIFQANWTQNQSHYYLKGSAFLDGVKEP